VSARKVAALRKAARAAGITVTDIGRFTSGSGKASFVDAQGRARKLARPSYSHF
jgi:hypothetical protein